MFEAPEGEGLPPSKEGLVCLRGLGFIFRAAGSRWDVLEGSDMLDGAEDTP